MITMDEISVVMSVYQGDKADQVAQAIDSIVLQDFQASELIIAVDGPVGPDIENALGQYSGLKFISIIWLPENVGLAASRNLAIQETTKNLIAVMDSDDVSDRRRLRLQLEAIKSKNVDVVGGYIEEFDNEIGDVQQLRTVPLDRPSIVSRSKWQNPINHVTLMFTREAYEKVGGYSSIRYSEDWHLIVRMLSAGLQVINLPQVLVYVRGGREMIARRRRWSQVLSDIGLLKWMLDFGHINGLQFGANVLIRLVLKLLPQFFTSSLYKLVLRTKKI